LSKKKKHLRFGSYPILLPMWHMGENPWIKIILILIRFKSDENNILQPAIR